MGYKTPQDLLFGSFKNTKFKKKVCIDDPATSTKLTYEDMDHETALAAALFKNLQVNSGNTVSLLLENGLHFFMPWLGAMRMGAVVHPVNCLYRPDQVLYALGLCETKLLVIQERYAWDDASNAPSQFLLKIREKFPKIKIVVMHDPQRTGNSHLEKGCGLPNTYSWSKLIKFMQPYDHIALLGENDPFQLICTSGTTGMPKAVVQHCGMFEPDVADLVKIYKFSENDRSLLINRLFHVNAQVTNFFTMALVGGTVVLAPPDPATILENILKHRITYSSAIPPTLKYILEHIKNSGLETKDKTREHMRFFIAGADILPPGLHRQFMKVTGIKVQPGWGMTETLCWGSGTPDGEPVIYGSIGEPLPHMDLKIVDPDKNWEEARPGEKGRLIVSGDAVFKGYYKNPEATEKAFFPSQKWGKKYFDTGDTCRRDGRGTYHFLGRASADSWKVRGEFVDGVAIDNFMLSNPGLSDAMAVPIKINSETETAVCAVLKPNHPEPDAELPGSISEFALLQFCEKGRLEGKLEKHIKIKNVIFVEEIELGDTGKKSRRKMAEIAQKRICEETSAVT